jgi:hypothetical protein
MTRMSCIDLVAEDDLRVGGARKVSVLLMIFD